jgi:polynucleotide 5'-hydroxyl-kinase GRC3/NOL9
VHASHCHAVPVLRSADETVLELQPHPAAMGLRQLAALNPAFAKLWNESQETNAKTKSSATFQIVCPLAGTRSIHC